MEQEKILQNSILIKRNNMKNNIKEYTYINRTDIKELKAMVHGKVLNIDPEKILSGAYVSGTLTTTTKKLRVAKLNPEDVKAKIIKYVESIYSEDGDKMPKAKKDVVKTEDLKIFIENGLTQDMIVAFYCGFKSIMDIKSDTELGALGGSIFNYETDYAPKIIDEAITNVKNGVFELAFKYPDFNWSSAGFKLSKSEIIDGKEYSWSKGTRKPKIKSETFKLKPNFIVVATKQIGYTENGEYIPYSGAEQTGKLDLQMGYLNLISKNGKDLFELAKKLLSQPEGYVKDLDWIRQGLGGGSPDDLKSANVEFNEGGEVNKLALIFDKLKKGDTISISYSSSISKNNSKNLKVTSKNIVGKGKTYESEKITFVNLENPKGVKFFAYKRNSGYVGFAVGDSAISNVEIKTETKFENGGRVDLFEDYDNQPIEVSEILSEYELEDNDYEILEELQSRLENETGYTFDYGLDATPYGLRPIGVKLSELEGYEDEYEEGGTIEKVYRHKHIPTMTFEIVSETNNGYKGIQKDPKSLSKIERSRGKLVSYSSADLKDLFTKETYAEGGEIYNAHILTNDNKLIHRRYPKKITHNEIYEEYKNKGVEIKDSQIHFAKPIDFYDTLRKETKKYVRENMNDDVDLESIFISSTQKGNEYIATEIKGDTISGKAFTLTPKDLFEVGGSTYAKGGEIESWEYKWGTWEATISRHPHRKEYRWAVYDKDGNYTYDFINDIDVELKTPLEAENNMFRNIEDRIGHTPKRQISSSTYAKGGGVEKSIRGFKIGDTFYNTPSTSGNTRYFKITSIDNNYLKADDYDFVLNGEDLRTGRTSTFPTVMFQIMVDEHEISRYERGDLYYSDGGNIPKGYHKMPDGKIMPDSAHYAQGGNTQVAQTIAEQLGGTGRLKMMTGAYNFGTSGNNLTFRIKNSFKVNYVRITLNGKDLYDLQFGRVSGTKFTIVKEYSDIYNDQLIELFEETTGMYLRFEHGGGVQKANMGYLAIAQGAKDILPNSVDSIDRKIANKVNKKTFWEKMNETGVPEIDNANADKYEKGGNMQSEQKERLLELARKHGYIK
jgi:hypothetical protein